MCATGVLTRKAYPTSRILNVTYSSTGNQHIVSRIYSLIGEYFGNLATPRSARLIFASISSWFQCDLLNFLRRASPDYICMALYLRVTGYDATETLANLHVHGWNCLNYKQVVTGQNGLKGKTGLYQDEKRNGWNGQSKNWMKIKLKKSRKTMI